MPFRVPNILGEFNGKICSECISCNLEFQNFPDPQSSEAQALSPSPPLVCGTQFVPPTSILFEHPAYLALKCRNNFCVRVFICVLLNRSLLKCHNVIFCLNPDIQFYHIIENTVGRDSCHFIGNLLDFLL